MLVKKQKKYFDDPLEHAWKVPDLFVHNFAYFSFDKLSKCRLDNKTRNLVIKKSFEFLLNSSFEK